MYGPRAILLAAVLSLTLAAATGWCFDLNKRLTIDIPPQPLSTALLLFSRQTALQIVASDEQVRDRVTAGVRGTLTLTQAMAKLLRGSGLSFEAVGESAVSVGLFSLDAEHSQSSAHGASGDNGLEDVLVTARRIPETTLSVPQSISVLTARDLVDLGIQSFDDYASKIPNLSFAYGTSGLGYGASRSLSIRGISGEGTTGFYIDDTPLPDSVDPYLIDLQRIEVLKGPQGTLFGEGSLGGNVRLITNQPSLSSNSFQLTGSGGKTAGGDGGDYGAGAIANIVVAEDRVAVRVVAFDKENAGWLTRTFPDATDPSETFAAAGQGRLQEHGGSATILAAVTDRLAVTAAIRSQRSTSNGLPVAYAPLPSFDPVSYTLDREADVPERIVDWFYLPSLQIALSGNGWSLANSLSYFRRDTSEIEDGTEGTQYVIDNYYGGTPPLGDSGVAWSSMRESTRINEELRLNWAGTTGWSGVVGARYGTDKESDSLASEAIAGIVSEKLSTSAIAWISSSRTAHNDVSLFGEAYYQWGNFEYTLGLRQYWLSEQTTWFADGLLDGGVTSSPNLRSSASGLNPRFVLSYKFIPDGLTYASVSKGFRVGGPNPTLAGVCTPGLEQLGLSSTSLLSSKPDTVWNYEVGAKGAVGNVTLSGALFQMAWRNIQQFVTLPICDVSLYTNAGSARNRGAEFELTGHMTPALEVRIGLGYDNAIITSSGLSGQPVGSHIYDAPALTANVATTVTAPLNADITGFLSADLSYTGASLSGTTLSGTQALTRPAYNQLNARIGLRWQTSEMTLYARNLFNEKANLGDINPISYVRRDSNGDPDPLVALLPPRQVGIEFKHSF